MSENVAAHSCRYAPFPTTGGTKLGTYKDANVATPRPDDKAYYDNLTELWNPLK